MSRGGQRHRRDHLRATDQYQYQTIGIKKGETGWGGGYEYE